MTFSFGWAKATARERDTGGCDSCGEHTAAL